MRSIMIDEKNDVYAIGDNTQLRKLCEEYANAGNRHTVPQDYGKAAWDV